MGSQTTMDSRRPQRLEDIAVSPGLRCPCCVSREKLGLTPAERDALWELREAHCNEPFDAQSTDTDRLLVEIWNIAFPSEPNQDSAPDKRWQRLGFQSSNPRTDVRTGRFALSQFHYFFEKYPQLAQKIVRQAEEYDYSLAITSFNLTHLVVVFFDLYNSATVSPVGGGVEQANLDQIQNFASLLCKGQGKAVLDELNCVLIEKLHLIWKDMRATENANLMDFPKAMRKLFDAHSAFWSVPRSEIADFRSMLVDHSD